MSSASSSLASSVVVDATVISKAAINPASAEVIATKPVITGSGTAEIVWQAWLSLRPLPLHDLAHWLPANTRLIVVAPHPDDEVLACGGLLAMHAAQGGSAVVIAVTDGEASHQFSTPEQLEELAATRCVERSEGLARLGLQDCEVKRLHVPDGQVWRHQSALTQQLSTLLKNDDVVVTTWRHDAHPDHEASAEAVIEAAQSINCRVLQAPIWMWHWASPNDARVPWEQLKGLQIDAAARDKKQAALAAHFSQLHPPAGASNAVLGMEVLERSQRSEEYFFVERFFV